MKLKNNLIVTLSDFAKHFDFVEFWEKRREFVRDMHPSRVYYWNQELANAYEEVVKWISCDSAADRVDDDGIKALELLVGRSFCREEILNYNGEMDFTSPIIRVQAGTELVLPQYSNEPLNEINLKYHKIEVYGYSDKPAVIKIGTRATATLYASEFIYVTENNNLFIEFMPVHIKNNRFSLNLISDDGKFTSTLIVKYLLSGGETSFKDVISFAVTDDGYFFIDSNSRLAIMNQSLLAMKFIFGKRTNAYYVKAHGNEVLVLYKDGKLISTNSKPLDNIISADFDSKCSINTIINKC